MDKSKQKGSAASSSSSSSSIATELFGPKEPSSSGSVFSSVFDQPSSAGKWNNSHQGKAYSDSKHWKSGPDSKDIRTCYYQQETVGPSYLSSSIYYGGQEVYSPDTCKTDNKPHKKNKDERDDDQDGSNLHGTSRGNWWKGSLYY